jgi:hypothetical protein
VGPPARCTPPGAHRPPRLPHPSLTLLPSLLPPPPFLLPPPSFPFLGSFSKTPLRCAPPPRGVFLRCRQATSPFPALRPSPRDFGQARAEDARRGNTRVFFHPTESKMASRRACYGFARSFLPPACFPPARGAASPPLPLFLPPMLMIFLGGAVRPKGGCRRKAPWSSLQRNSTPT